MALPGIKYFLWISCALFLAVLMPLCQGVEIERVVKFALKKQDFVKIRIFFRVLTEEPYHVTWTDRHGRRIVPPENLEGAAEEDKEDSNKRMTEIIVRERFSPVTAYLGSGMKWLSLTIDATQVNQRQINVQTPVLEIGKITHKGIPVGNHLIYTRNQKLNFQLTHSPVPLEDFQYEDPFAYLPLYIYVHAFEEGELIKSTVAGSGLFYIEPAEVTKNEDGKEVVEKTNFDFMPNSWGAQSGIVSMSYTDHRLGDLVQTIQIGKVLLFYPKGLTGPFEPDRLGISHDFFMDYEEVRCYNPYFKCEVSCLAVSGSEYFNVTLYKIHDKVRELLVTVSRDANEPVAQIEIPAFPDNQEDPYVDYMCEVQDNKGRSRITLIKTNFKMFASVDKERSFVRAVDGGYEALCVVKGFPTPTVTLTFHFDDPDLTQEVEPEFKFPYWDTVVAHTVLKVDSCSGVPKGVSCKAESQGMYGSSATDFIKFEK